MESCRDIILSPENSTPAWWSVYHPVESPLVASHKAFLSFFRSLSPLTTSTLAIFFPSCTWCTLCPVPAHMPSPPLKARLTLSFLPLSLPQSQDHHHFLDLPPFSFGPGFQSSKTSLCSLSIPLGFSLNVYVSSLLDSKLKDNGNYLCPVLNL